MAKNRSVKEAKIQPQTVKTPSNQANLAPELVTKPLEKEVSGVRFDRQNGVSRCPKCLSRSIKTVNTQPWEGNIRIRYHLCGFCGNKFKSIEE